LAKGPTPDGGKSQLGRGKLNETSGSGGNQHLAQLLYCHWHASPDQSADTKTGARTVTIKSSVFAAVAALLVSSITVGAAVAPAQAQAVSLPLRTMVNA
jgi:hypothetical protein